VNREIAVNRVINRRLKRTIETLERHDRLVVSGEYGHQLRRRLLDLMEIRRKRKWTPSFSLIGFYVAACGALLISSVAPIAWFHWPEMSGDLLLSAVRVVLSSDSTEAHTNVILGRTLQITLDGNEIVDLDGTQLAIPFSNESTTVSELVLTVPAGGPKVALDFPMVIGGSKIGVSKSNGGRWKFEVEPGNAQKVLEYGMTLPTGTTVAAVSVEGETQRRAATDRPSSMTVKGASVLRVELEGIDARSRLFQDHISASLVAMVTAVPHGSGKLRSSVVGGEISLPEVNDKLMLRPGQLVTWKLGEAVIWEMLVGGVEPLHLRIEARARRIAVNRRSQNPSVMRFVSESRWFDLVWTSIVAVTGFFFLLSRLRQS